MAEVRALTPDEWQITRQLRLAALLDSPDAFCSTYEQTLLRTEADWRQWPGGGQVFAAFLDGIPVGMTCGASTGDPRITHLISMWVDPSARGHHIGRALIDAVSGWARERGSSIVELDVFERNEPAHRAYLKAGFSAVGPCPDHPSAITMHLPLDQD